MKDVLFLDSSERGLMSVTFVFDRNSSYEHREAKSLTEVARSFTHDRRLLVELDASIAYFATSEEGLSRPYPPPEPKASELPGEEKT